MLIRVNRPKFLGLLRLISNFVLAKGLAVPAENLVERMLDAMENVNCKCLRDAAVSSSFCDYKLGIR
jgi:hypothetical protein